MRICPKCNKLELDVEPDMKLDSPEGYCNLKGTFSKQGFEE